MDMQILSSVLLWSAALNYAILLLWFVIFAAARGWFYKMHTLWFKLSPEAFDLFHYGGIGLYKLLIFVFNLAPWIAIQFAT